MELSYGQDDRLGRDEQLPQFGGVWQVSLPHLLLWVDAHGRKRAMETRVPTKHLWGPIDQNVVSFHL